VAQLPVDGEQGLDRREPQRVAAVRLEAGLENQRLGDPDQLLAQQSLGRDRSEDLIGHDCSFPGGRPVSDVRRAVPSLGMPFRPPPVAQSARCAE